jgi:tryptophan synthase alpha subunit
MTQTLMSGGGRPTDEEILAKVSTYPQGVDALELTEQFVREGYDSYSVQRAMQRALDKGVVELGSKLRLYAPERQVVAA